MGIIFLLTATGFTHFLTERHKVHEANGDDGCQMIVPFSHWPLIADGSGSIENGAVDEVGLWTIQHLHNNLFTIVCRTEEIEHDVAVIVRFRNLLCIAEVQIGDPHFSCKKSVEEVNEQIF